MAVQQELASILDLFQSLEAELEMGLETEMAAHRRQYEHYRSSLLTSSHSDGMRGVTLGDIFEMKAGRFIPAAALSANQDGPYQIPCYGGHGIRGFLMEHTHDGRHLIVGRQGALCGNVQRTNGKFYATEHAVVVTPIPTVDADWAFHMLTVMNLNQYATKSAQPGLSVGRLRSVPISVPPLEGQKRIASILDRFSTHVTDLSVSLSAELGARRKQYEYYRDRLLSFKEAA
jgi:type I restriction enzyme S subunit